jgi:hypothetical protein
MVGVVTGVWVLFNFIFLMLLASIIDFLSPHRMTICILETHVFALASTVSRFHSFLLVHYTLLLSHDKISIYMSVCNVSENSDTHQHHQVEDPYQTYERLFTPRNYI